jgi:hypothetical protein
MTTEREELDKALDALLSGPAPFTPGHTLNTEKTAAVSTTQYWEPMKDCPRGVKVQLLGLGGVAVYGMYDGRNPFWEGWAPLPKRRENQVK